MLKIKHEIKGVAYATPTDGFGTIYDVTYAGTKTCDSGVRFGYLKSLARDGYRVEIAASNADGDKPVTLQPYSE